MEGRRTGAAFPAQTLAWLQAHQRVAASVVSVACLLAMHWYWAVTQLLFDAAHYWDLAHPAVLWGQPGLRGYLLPTLLAPLRAVVLMAPDPIAAYRVGMSLVYGVVLALMVPWVFQVAFGGAMGFFRRLVPVALLAGLFPGVLAYTLSDLPALLLTLAALGVGLRAQDHGGMLRRGAWLLAAGMLAGAAYNVRPIYLFAIAGLMVLSDRSASRQGATPVRRLVGLACIVAGLLLISLPQLALNLKTHGVASLRVQTAIGERDLFTSQLVWGLTLQRYETVGKGSHSSEFYLDADGIELMEQAAREGDLFTLPHYLATVVSHPLEFIALYTRHVVNGLDLRDGIVYTRESSTLRGRTALLNFLVLAFAACVAWTQLRVPPATCGSAMKPAHPEWTWALLVLLLPVAAVVPGAIETRFFLPVHLLAYCIIAFRFDAASCLPVMRRHAAALVVVVAAVGVLFFAISQATMSQQQRVWPDAYRQGRVPS